MPSSVTSSRRAFTSRKKQFARREEEEEEASVLTLASSGVKGKSKGKARRSSVTTCIECGDVEGLSALHHSHALTQGEAAVRRRAARRGVLSFQRCSSRRHPPPRPAPPRGRVSSLTTCSPIGRPTPLPPPVQVLCAMLLQTEAFDAHDQARLTFALQCTRGDPNDAGGSYDEGDERTRANVALLRSAAGGGITAALAKLLHGESESVRAYMHEAKAKSKMPKKGTKKGRTAASPRPNEAKLALLLKIIGGLFIDVEAEAKDFAGAAFVLSSAFIAGASPARKRARRGAAARSADTTTHNALAALATLAAHDAYSRAIRAACVATAKDLVLCTSTGEKKTARALCGANAESAAAIETFASLFIDVVETPAVLLELAELLAFVERAGALDAKSELKTTHVVLDVDGACASGARSTAVNSVAIATALKRTLAAQRGPRGAATYRFDDVVAIEIVRVVLEARVERCALRCAGGGASHVAARIAAHAVFSVTLRSTMKEEKIGHGVCYVSVAGLGVSILGEQEEESLQDLLKRVSTEKQAAKRAARRKTKTRAERPAPSGAAAPVTAAAAVMAKSTMTQVSLFYLPLHFVRILLTI